MTISYCMAVVYEMMLNSESFALHDKHLDRHQDGACIFERQLPECLKYSFPVWFLFLLLKFVSPLVYLWVDVSSSLYTL